MRHSLSTNLRPIFLFKKIDFFGAINATTQEINMNQTEVIQYEVPQCEVKQDEAREVVRIEDVLNIATEKGIKFQFNPDTGIATFMFNCSRMMNNGRQFSAYVLLTQRKGSVELYRRAAELEDGRKQSTTFEEVFSILERYINYTTEVRGRFPALEQQLTKNEEKSRELQEYGEYCRRSEEYLNNELLELAEFAAESTWSDLDEECEEESLDLDEERRK